MLSHAPSSPMQMTVLAHHPQRCPHEIKLSYVNVSAVYRPGHTVCALSALSRHLPCPFVVFFPHPLALLNTVHLPSQYPYRPLSAFLSLIKMSSSAQRMHNAYPEGFSVVVQVSPLRSEVENTGGDGHSSGDRHYASGASYSLLSSFLYHCHIFCLP